MATLEGQPEWGRGERGALEDALGAVARRLRLGRWVRHASRGTLAAVAVSLVAVILDHFDLLPDALPLALIIALAFGIGLLGGTLTSLLRPINPMTVARIAEMRLGLKERLSSALEFERTGGSGSHALPETFLRLQRQDARDYAQRLKATEAAPIPIPWETKVLGPALLVLLLALILPNLPIFLPKGVILERSIVKKEGQTLAKTARIIQKTATAQNLPATKRASVAMQRLARRMAQGHMDKRQAMVRMSALTKQMQAQQKQLAQQAGQTALDGGKSLAQAGQQLAALLQSQSANGQNGQGASKSQGENGAGSKAKGAQSGPSGTHSPGDKSGKQGFNVPGKLARKQAQNGQNPTGNTQQSTPEVQKMAQAMQNNDAQTLSQQLRQLANKTASGQLSPGQQQQTASDLKNLSKALQGTGMPETQQHVQAASQAMARGDKQTAAQELRKAADAAQREAQEQADSQGMQNAQQSLQSSEDDMASAQNPGDVSDGQDGQPCPPGDVCQPCQAGQPCPPADKNGQPCPPGESCQPCQPGQPCSSSNQPGSGPPIVADGTPGNGGFGAGRGKPSTQYQKGQRPNRRVVEKPGSGKGAPHWLDPHFDPTKNPNYKRIYFGKPQTAGPSQSGPTRKARPGQDTGPVTSSVPYYNTVITARKSAESAMDRENIPPSYKNDVSKYFNSLQPESGPAATNPASATH
jgi:hypothetical protein